MKNAASVDEMHGITSEKPRTHHAYQEAKMPGSEGEHVNRGCPPLRQQFPWR